MFKKMICTLGVTCITVLTLGQGVFANEINIEKNIDVGEQNKYEVHKAPLLYSNGGSSNKSLFLNMVKDSELTKEEVNVCIYDDYETEYTYDDSSGIFYHGDIVQGFLNKHMFNDEAFKIHKFDSDKNNLFYKEYDEKIKNCDVLNISMSFFIDDETISDSQKSTYNQILAQSLNHFLTDLNAFTVASAGNNNIDANEQTLFAIMRESLADSENKDKYLITGQIEKNSVFENSFAYGKSVDIMVANKWEILGDYKYTGTSYASPVISAIAANLYLAGFDYKEIYSLLTSSSTIYEDNYSTYPVFNEEEVYNKAIESLKLKQEQEKNKDVPQPTIEVNKGQSDSSHIKLFKVFSKIHKQSFGLNS